MAEIKCFCPKTGDQVGSAWWPSGKTVACSKNKFAKFEATGPATIRTPLACENCTSTTSNTQTKPNKPTHY